MFMIPGVGEAIRINGTGRIRVDQAVRDSFAVQGKIPQSVIEITVDSIYFQCQKAIYRSKLWDPDSIIDRSSLPTAGQITKALSSVPFDDQAYDREYPERMKNTAY